MRRSFFFIVLFVFNFTLQAQNNLPSLQLSEDQYKQLEKHFAEKERTRNRNNEWARYSRYEAMNDTMAKPAKVVFMGNSITEGWYRQSPDFFHKNGFTGRGISGQTTSQMLARFQSDVIALQPKAVVIMAGTNDLARNTGIISHKHILQNIRSMCELARYNNIKPILCSILPAAEFRWNPELKPAEDVKLLNNLIRDYARRSNIPYVDFYSLLVDNRGGLPSDIASDGVHPNLKGYQIMEPVLLKEIRKIVRK
jgi:lysophospholipase L1-like esterase